MTTTSVLEPLDFTDHWIYVYVSPDGALKFSIEPPTITRYRGGPASHKLFDGVAWDCQGAHHVKPYRKLETAAERANPCDCGAYGLPHAHGADGGWIRYPEGDQACLDAP